MLPDYAARRRSVVVALVAGPLFGALSPAIGQTIPLEIGATPSGDVTALAGDGVQKALAALPGIVADVKARSGVPGIAVAVVHGGGTVFAQGYGTRKAGTDEPVDADTVFQIASLSKPIAATIAAIRVSDRTVSWDDEAVRHLPSLALSDPYVTAHATIGDFFSHRTGLPPGAGDDLEDMGFDRATIIARLKEMPLDVFRITYHYANYGVTIGAEAVAAASGGTWEDLAQAALFEPLGMAMTSYRYADFLARDNRATLHALVDGRLQPLFERDPDPQAPAGGVSSSVNDLARWLALLLAGGKREGTALFNEAAIVPAMRAQSVSSPAQSLDTRSSFYGYGFGVGIGANGRRELSHSGAFVLGAGTTMELIPSADIAIVVLTNAGPIGAAEAIASQFMDIVQYGETHRDWFAGLNSLLSAYYTPVGDLAGRKPPENAVPARPLHVYAGRYENSYFGHAEIRREGNGLVFVVGAGDAVHLTMTPWGGDTFAIAPVSENAPVGSLSSLAFRFHGLSASGFTVNYLDENGLGTWTR